MLRQQLKDYNVHGESLTDVWQEAGKKLASSQRASAENLPQSAAKRKVNEAGRGTEKNCVNAVLSLNEAHNVNFCMACCF